MEGETPTAQHGRRTNRNAAEAYGTLFFVARRMSSFARLNDNGDLELGSSGRRRQVGMAEVRQIGNLSSWREVVRTLCDE
jgi:hypothetical protein